MKNPRIASPIVIPSRENLVSNLLRRTNNSKFTFAFLRKQRSCLTRCETISNSYTQFCCGTEAYINRIRILVLCFGNRWRQKKSAPLKADFDYRSEIILRKDQTGWEEWDYCSVVFWTRENVMEHRCFRIIDAEEERGVPGSERNAL